MSRYISTRHTAAMNIDEVDSKFGAAVLQEVSSQENSSYGTLRYKKYGDNHLFTQMAPDSVGLSVRNHTTSCAADRIDRLPDDIFLHIIFPLLWCDPMEPMNNEGWNPMQSPNQTFIKLIHSLSSFSLVCKRFRQMVDKSPWVLPITLHQQLSVLSEKDTIPAHIQQMARRGKDGSFSHWRLSFCDWNTFRETASTTWIRLWKIMHDNLQDSLWDKVCTFGEIEIVKGLVQLGADVNDGGALPLLLASANGHLSVVTFLVENGAEVCADNDELEAPISGAAANGHLEVIKYLVEKGADVNTRNGEPLRCAAEQNRVQVLKYLVEQGADVHEFNDYALRVAAERGYVEVIQHVVGNGADVNVRNGDPLRSAAKRGDLEIIKCLVENGADVHALNDYAIQAAAKRGYLEIVKFLVQNGANLHVLNDNPLCAAAQEGHLEVVQFLVENGAHVNAQNDTPAREAARKGHMQVLEFLLANGANAQV